MPTIRNLGPYRLFFYSNEGTEPRHVHVQRDQQMAKFWLDPVELASSSRFKAHELRKPTSLKIEDRTNLVEAWNEFFGR